MRTWIEMADETTALIAFQNSRQDESLYAEQEKFLRIRFQLFHIAIERSSCWPDIEALKVGGTLIADDYGL
jgi:hypothetical protein